MRVHASGEIIVTRIGFVCSRERPDETPEMALQKMLRAMVAHGHRIISVSVCEGREDDAYECYIVSAWNEHE